MVGRPKRAAKKAAGPKPGRPPLLPLVHENVVRMIRNGNYIDTSAAANGVSKQTVHDWLRRGRREARRIEAGGAPKESEAIYVAFSNDVDAAEADCEVRLVGNAMTFAEESWQATFTFLERRHPARWSKAVRIQVEQEITAVLEALRERLDPDVFETVLEVIMEGGEDA